MELDIIGRANPDYVDALYEAFRRDPESVDRLWQLVFAGYEFGANQPPGVGAVGDPRVRDLVHAYREFGHLVADLQPLDRAPRSHPLLRVEEVGFEASDLDRVVDSGSFGGLGRVPLRELVAALRATYCGTLAFEYVFIPDKARRDWFQHRVEGDWPAADRGRRRRILAELIAAESFEQFLQARYPGQKRFSLEGAEALIPLLSTIADHAAAADVRECVMGMPHRGRLNVLAHVLQKPYELILAEFEGSALPWDVHGDGDVKYHLGYSHDHLAPEGRRIHLSLASNPSHLEAINPVVEGIVRAKESYLGDAERHRVLPVLLHGDAAFLGQGSVYETVALSTLPGFTTGGTIHVIIDNQIGFTTDPADYRFTRYPSDLARVVRAPVLHVNGDAPDAVVRAAELAVAFRQTFGADVFVHFVCYRRHGHNEVDDPTVTQPALYRAIRSHPTAAALYAERLAQESVTPADEVARLRGEVAGKLDQALAGARQNMPRQRVFVFGGVWKGLTWAGNDWSARTAVPADRLRALADAATRVPEGFHVHQRVARVIEERRRAVTVGRDIDWANAEALAFGSLLVEGIPVRLSGQDSIRGTFGQRHAELYDGETGARHVPLAHLDPVQAEFEVVNSPLSEVGVVGFEYGLSSGDPRRLVLWEAQFGDFTNGAQVIVDQFIAAGESKWQRMSGLVLLLPHGYEGQGPEHSSARLERFLQLCAEGNMQVVNCTTPAQYFHVLRRQMHRSFRKPLVIMTPKSLLRHTRAVSAIGDFTDGGFRPVLPDPDAPDGAGVQRLLLCSGKIFYALSHARAERGWGGIAIARIEELYPFPEKELRAVIASYPEAADVRWVQEEPRNQGAWSFVSPRIEQLLGDRALRYVGRLEAASPATGSHKGHQDEEQCILEHALKRPRPARATATDGGGAPSAPA